MSFSVRKQKPTHDNSLEQEILRNTEIKTEEDLKKFLANVSINGLSSKPDKNIKVSGFVNRRSKNDEEL